MLELGFSPLPRVKSQGGIGLVRGRVKVRDRLESVQVTCNLLRRGVA